MRLTLITLVALSFGVSALADHHVGDKIHRAGTIIKTEPGQQPVSGTVALDMELTSKDATNGKFQMRSTVSLAGQVINSKDEWIAPTDAYTKEEAAQIVANCAQFKGTAETLTYGTQTVNVCTVPIDRNGCKGTVSVGEVPFGVAAEKETCTNGNSLALPAPASQGGELTFVWGTN